MKGRSAGLLLNGWGGGVRGAIVRTNIRKQDAMLRALQINYTENKTKENT